MHDESSERLLRNTRSVCPRCQNVVPARIVSQGSSVLMKRICSSDGVTSVILSRDVDFYEQISKAYFAIMPQNLPQQLIALTLTRKCSLACPICFAIRTLAHKVRDFDLVDLDLVIQQNSEKEFLLWGMEPTEHPDICEILRRIKKSGREGYVLSNGLRLKDFDFTKRLMESGLSHIYFQFEGFDDEVYQKLRGVRLLDVKLAALANLKSLGVPTSLEVVLAKGVNEDQINNIIDYAIRNAFIRQVSFLPLISYRKDAGEVRDGMLPDYYEFLKVIEEKTGGRISRDKMRAFQKIMYFVYRISKVRKCFYFMSFILVRDRRGSYVPIDEYIDLFKAEKIIDEAVTKRNGTWDRSFDVSLGLKLTRAAKGMKTLSLLWKYIKFVLSGKRMKSLGMSSDLLFITYIENCDIFKADIDMSENFCQETTVVKGLDGKLVARLGYQTMIESYKDLMR